MHRQIIFQFLLVNLITCLKDEATPYIIGGWKVHEKSIPWIVSIRYFGIPICGGTIIDENYILTAAHCMRYFSLAYTITAGEMHLSKDHAEEQRRSVIEVHQHPGFDMVTLQNDISIVRVNQSFVMNEYVQPAKFANSSFNPSIGEVWAVGWGFENENDVQLSEYLNQVEMKLLDDRTCRSKLYSMKGIHYNPGMFCGIGYEHGTGTCFGDSGSPVYSISSNTGNKIVFGLASATGRCASTYLPSIYTNISYYSHWIKNRIDKSNSLYSNKILP